MLGPMGGRSGRTNSLHLLSNIGQYMLIRGFGDGVRYLGMLEPSEYVWDIGAMGYKHNLHLECCNTLQTIAQYMVQI